MNLKTLATVAATIVASSTWAATPADTKCGAGTCGKKEQTASRASAAKEASCSKKEDSSTTKDASCAKKEASCSKKDASCSKK